MRKFPLGASFGNIFLSSRIADEDDERKIFFFCRKAAYDIQYILRAVEVNKKKSERRISARVKLKPTLKLFRD